MSDSCVTVCHSRGHCLAGTGVTNPYYSNVGNLGGGNITWTD